MALRLIIGSFPLPDNDVISNDGRILGGIDRAELHALFDRGALAQNSAADVRAALNVRTRQQHRVLDHGALLDDDIGRKDRVASGAVDLAAVGDQAVVQAAVRANVVRRTRGAVP